MGKNVVNILEPSFLIESSLFLQVTRTCMKSWMTSNFGQIPPPLLDLSALECLKKNNVVNTLVPSFLIGCSSFLQITRKTVSFG